MTEKKSEAPKFRYEDNPQLTETFADSVGGWLFDGNSLRIDFLVSRLEPKRGSDNILGRKVPACRLVLTPAAAVELMNRFRQLAGALEKAGVVKTKQAEKAETKAN